MSELKNLWSGMILLILFTFSIVSAQYIIEQSESTIPVNFDLMPEGTEFESVIDEARYFLEMPEEKLKAGALSAGLEVRTDKTIYYMDGNNFALENTSSEEGKTTVISDYQKGSMYYVIWAQKKVIEMTKEDMESIGQQTTAMTEKMMQNLSPELRAQMEAMEDEKMESSSPEATPTSRKANKYGFDCKEYMVEGEEDLIFIWATEDVFGLTEIVRQNAEKMSAIFEPAGEADADEWDFVSGKVPIEVKTFSMGMMGSPEIEIRAITKISKTKPPADKFIPPGEAQGFTRGSMQDMMQQMMKLMQGNDEE